MASAPPTTFSRCPACGMQLGNLANTGGLCPRCLIAEAIEQLNTVDHPALGRFGTLGTTPDITLLNKRLTAYEFLGLLGRGGAGWVFRARQRSLNRPVAIKILHSGPGGVVDAAQRFAREAQILARLNHPRIVTVHDFGTLGDAQYLVMEYVAGPTLREVLRGPALGAQSLEIAEHICEAVAYAHSIGVLHRDLKPENVLFESFDDLDSLKVVDFGISRLIGGTEPGFHRTQTGFVVGTPFYAAPEQMAANQPVDIRSDIYSIGVMLYEMLTGQIPRGRFALPSRHRNVPRGSDAIVMRCLESEPSQRYPDVAAISSELRAVISGAGRRRVILKYAAAAAGCGVVIAATSWLLANRRTEPIASAPATVVSQTPVQTPETDPSNAASKVNEDGPVPSVSQPVPAPVTSPEGNTPAAPPGGELESTSQTQPALSPALPPPNPTTPPRDEDYFHIDSARAYGFMPTGLEFRIAGDQRYLNFQPREGASLVWVVQTAGVHRIDTPFRVDDLTKKFSIAGRVTLDFGDAWPLEIYVAERWDSPERGSRRLSNSVRVNADDVLRAAPPRMTPR